MSSSRAPGAPLCTLTSSPSPSNRKYTPKFLRVVRRWGEVGQWGGRSVRVRRVVVVVVVVDGAP